MGNASAWMKPRMQWGWSNLLLSISGCLSHERKMGNQTDQSKSPTSSGTAILIGQFDFLFYVHGTSNLKSMVCINCSHISLPAYTSHNNYYLRNNVTMATDKHSMNNSTIHHSYAHYQKEPCILSLPAYTSHNNYYLRNNVPMATDKPNSAEVSCDWHRCAPYGEAYTPTPTPTPHGVPTCPLVALSLSNWVFHSQRVGQIPIPHTRSYHLLLEIWKGNKKYTVKRVHVWVCACMSATISTHQCFHLTDDTDYSNTINCKTLHFIASQHTYHLWLWLTHSPQPQSITQSFLTNSFVPSHLPFTLTNHRSTLSSSPSHSALRSHHHPSPKPPHHSYHHYSHLHPWLH